MVCMDPGPGGQIDPLKCHLEAETIKLLVSASKSTLEVPFRSWDYQFGVILVTFWSVFDPKMHYTPKWSHFRPNFFQKHNDSPLKVFSSKTPKNPNFAVFWPKIVRFCTFFGPFLSGFSKFLFKRWPHFLSKNIVLYVKNFMDFGQNLTKTWSALAQDPAKNVEKKRVFLQNAVLSLPPSEGGHFWTHFWTIFGPIFGPKFDPFLTYY